MEIWSFKTIYCLNLNTHCQKRHDVTNDVKVNFMICGFAGCIKNMLFLASIHFYNTWHLCIGIRKKIDIDSFLHDLKTTDLC